MSDNILEPTINGLPPVTDWQKVFLALQQANEAFLRGATLPELGKQIVGDVQIQGADFVDLPVAEDSTPVALPIPETGNKFGFLADGKFTQPTGGTLEYSATQWGLTLFDGDKWVKKFTLEMPEQSVVDNLNSESTDESLSANQGKLLNEKKLEKDAFQSELFNKVGAAADPEDMEFSIVDGNGREAFKVDRDGNVEYNGRFDKNEIPSEFNIRGLLALEDDKFAITDPLGNAILIAEKNKVNFIGSQNQFINQSSLHQIDELASDTFTVTDFPRHSKKGIILSFSCFLDNLTTGSIQLGFGKLQYRGRYFKITSTSVFPMRYESSEAIGAAIPHNLVIESFLNVSLYVDDSGNGYIILTTKNGNSKITYDWGFESNYDPFIISEDLTIKDVKFNLSNKDFKRDIWVFTDSYGGVASNRWPGVMKDLGFFNFYHNGLAGQRSTGAILDVKKALLCGRPKHIIWGLGMNDSNSDYVTVLNELIGICNDNNIHLVLATIPTIPSRSKEYISNIVRTSGFRYIDFAKSVVSEETGLWYAGMLGADEVHPTDLGAKSLASQVLIDFPEIMQNGLISTSSEIGDITGDN